MRLPFVPCSGTAALVDFRAEHAARRQAHHSSCLLPRVQHDALLDDPPAERHQARFEPLEVVMQALVVDGLLQFEPLQELSRRDLRLCNKHTHAVLSQVLAHPSSAAQAALQAPPAAPGSALAAAAFQACSAAAHTADGGAGYLEAHCLLREVSVAGPGLAQRRCVGPTPRPERQASGCSLVAGSPHLFNQLAIGRDEGHARHLLHGPHHRQPCLQHSCCCQGEDHAPRLHLAVV